MSSQPEISAASVNLTPEGVEKNPERIAAALAAEQAARDRMARAGRALVELMPLGWYARKVSEAVADTGEPGAVHDALEVIEDAHRAADRWNEALDEVCRAAANIPARR